MLRAEASRFGRTDWLEAAVVAAALFALYAATSPRSLALEDDGLFVLSSYFLGIEHPPGYPLFTLLGKLATLLPFGSVAYRVHLVSALFGALTCAMIWMCARQIAPGRLPAYVSALGLGFSRTFWSQSVIAEVYTLNTFFLFLVLYLALRAQSQAGAGPRARLPAIAFVFGLSLSNHWPLMLLAAPGLPVLLWPRRAELIQRLPLLVLVFVLGLTPYAWMIVRSWAPLPISFYGPLETFRDVWFMLSRSGYAAVDVSQTATWLDRFRFHSFFGTELIFQFAIAGFALAALGFWAQWRVLGRRISWALTLAFAGPSLVLLLLLGFDYDALHKHIFHVYPLPAYGIAALWLAVGTAWLAQRPGLPYPAVAGACVAVLAAILATGWHWNRDTDNWTTRYAAALLETLPRDAVLIAMGDSDLLPLAYYHMVEGQRGDLTFLQPAGLILGNRPLHPLRVTEAAMKDFLVKRIKEETGVVASTLFAESYIAELPRRDSWLFQVVDRTPGAKGKSIDVPERLVRFFEADVLSRSEPNAWAAALQGELRRSYARLVTTQLAPGEAPAPRTARHVAALEQDFLGAIGLLEGLLSNERGYEVRRAVELLDKARDRMPLDASKRNQSRYFELRAYLRQAQRDETGAIADLETALQIWPVAENTAIAALLDAYAKTGQLQAAAALKARFSR